MLARVISGANGVIADFVVWAFAHDAVTAVDMLGDPHFIGDDLSEFQGGAAGAVFFVAMMPFDDLDIRAVGDIFEGSRGLFGEFHCHVDRHAHIGCVADRDRFGPLFDPSDLRRAQTGGGDHERNAVGRAMVEGGHAPVGARKIDDRIEGCGPSVGQRQIDGTDTGDGTGILVSVARDGSDEGSDQFDGGIGMSEGNQPPSVSSGGTENGKSYGMCHAR